MNNTYFSRMVFRFLFLLIVYVPSCFCQTDSSQVYPEFDSQLLKLKVPEAFQRSSLKLEIYADSSWQLFRGNEALDFKQSLHLLGQEDLIEKYEYHLAKVGEYTNEYRSRRVFALFSISGGLAYLSFIWSKGWVYQIPGYAAVAIGSVRYFESRKFEMQALREQYYFQTIVSPAKIQALVEDYNFRLYRYLSTAGIQFSDS